MQQLSITRTVDPHGNILAEHFPKGISIQKSYDSFHRPLTISLPDQGNIAYTYDPLHCKSISRISPSGDALYTHQYETYDSSGYLTSESLMANLGRVAHETNLKGQPSAVSSDYFTQTCSFDEVGNLTNQIVNGNSVDFNYDDLSQLTSEPDHSYAYDSTFNRVQDNGISCEHNPLDEQLSNGSSQCKYDLKGNLISKSLQGQTQTFSYDPLNRLIEAVNGSKKVCFTYDPLDRKIGKTLYTLTGGEWQEITQESVLYDGNNDIGTVSPEGEIKQLRILGPSAHPEAPTTVAIELEGKPYAPLLDCQGNIRGLIDAAAKEVAASYDYTAFGQQKLSDQTPFNPWQYASKRLDRDLSLIDFGKRHYDPLLGRWLSVDPAGFIDSHNLYQYNFNNPFRYTDPDGQFVFAIPLLWGAFSVGAAGVTVVAIEITTTQLLVGSLVTGATLWGLHEGLTAIDRALDNRRFSPYMQQESLSEEEKKKKPPYNGQDLGDNPAKCPGEGFEWKGKDSPGGRRGSWHNSETNESLHPDLNHPLPKKPHWDYSGPEFPNGTRLYTDGTWEPKI